MRYRDSSKDNQMNVNRPGAELGIFQGSKANTIIDGDLVLTMQGERALVFHE